MRQMGWVADYVVVEVSRYEGRVIPFCTGPVSTFNFIKKLSRIRDLNLDGFAEVCERPGIKGLWSIGVSNLHGDNSCFQNAFILPKIKKLINFLFIINQV